MKDHNFIKSMTAIEAIAWNSFVLVVQNFLGNHKLANYEKLYKICFKNVGVNMSIKFYFLHSHLHLFPDNLGDYIEEQGIKISG